MSQLPRTVHPLQVNLRSIYFSSAISKPYSLKILSLMLQVPSSCRLHTLLPESKLITAAPEDLKALFSTHIVLNVWGLPDPRLIMVVPFHVHHSLPLDNPPPPHLPTTFQPWYPYPPSLSV